MLRDNAKRLRVNMTDAERRLWYLLHAHRFRGFKFKRQVPIGRYIVDFVCFEMQLIIEIDGGQHDGETDRPRTQWLERQGFRVLRFWNNDVLKSTGEILEVILAELGRSMQNPSPGTPPRGAPPSSARGEGTTGQ